MNKPVSGKSHWTVVEANQREEGQLLLDFTKWKIKRAHSQEAISGGKGLGGGALRSTGEMKEQGERIQLRPPGERKTAPSPGALLSLPLTLNTPQGNSFISQLFIRSIQSSLWPSGLGIWCCHWCGSRLQSLLWCGFDPWPGNFLMLWVWQKTKTKTNQKTPPKHPVFPAPS